MPGSAQLPAELARPARRRARKRSPRADTVPTLGRSTAPQTRPLRAHEHHATRSPGSPGHARRNLGWWRGIRSDPRRRRTTNAARTVYPGARILRVASVCRSANRVRCRSTPSERRRNRRTQSTGPTDSRARTDGATSRELPPLSSKRRLRHPLDPRRRPYAHPEPADHHDHAGGNRRGDRKQRYHGTAAATTAELARGRQQSISQPAGWPERTRAGRRQEL